jgi:uncharacterized membrane protein YccF (DUF307 family)
LALILFGFWLALSGIYYRWFIALVVGCSIGVAVADILVGSTSPEGR